MFGKCDELRKNEETTTKKSNAKNPEQYIQNKLDEYSQSFTIHGLSRSLRSKTGESVFWLTMLLAGLLQLSCRLGLQNRVPLYRFCLFISPYKILNLVK